MSANTDITIDQALRDRQLLGSALGPTSSWATWLTTLKAAFGIELNRVERRAFASVAGSRKPPTEKVHELWCICGRGSGKSRMAAAIAVYIACFLKHDLDPGETGYVLILAANRDQAGVVHRYCSSFIQRSKILRKMVRNQTSSEIQLTNNVVIATHANSFRSIRGRALVGVIFDECSIWRDDSSANPDNEVFRACKPSLVRCNGMLIGISTPYRKSGLLYARWADHFGVDDDDVLVVHGPTTAFNPTIDEKKIAKELASDREGATSEWLAEWRSDVSGLLDDQVIEDAIDYARPLELPPRAGLKYHAFTDSSAGRNDAFTLTIGHTEGKKEEARWFGDVIRGVSAPFDPRSVAQEFAQVCRQYGIHKIIGDAFAGAWTANAFADAGIQYETCKLTKSQLYLESVATFNRGAVSIPNHDKLLRELRMLERRVHRSGRDSVDHPRHGSDDLANALVGALYIAMNELRRPRITTGFWCPVVVPCYDYSKGNVSYPNEEPEQSGRITITRISEEEALEQKAKGTW